MSSPGQIDINPWAFEYIYNQAYLKKQSLSLKGKPYYETRVTKVVMAMFYTLTGVIRNKEKLSEPLPNRDIRDAIRHQLSFGEIIRFKQHKSINLMFWMVGILPPSLSVYMITIIGRAKKLI